MVILCILLQDPTLLHLTWTLKSSPAVMTLLRYYSLIHCSQSTQPQSFLERQAVVSRCRPGLRNQCCTLTTSQTIQVPGTPGWKGRQPARGLSKGGSCCTQRPSVPYLSSSRLSAFLLLHLRAVRGCLNNTYFIAPFRFSTAIVH